MMPMNVVLKDFPDTTWRDVKIIALKQGMTVRDLAEKVFKDYLEQQKNEDGGVSQ